MPYRTTYGQEVKRQMTKKWITSPRDRKTAKYKAIHAQLRDELMPEPSKAERKRAASQSFRARGE